MLLASEPWWQHYSLITRVVFRTIFFQISGLSSWEPCLKIIQEIIKVQFREPSMIFILVDVCSSLPVIFNCLFLLEGICFEDDCSDMAVGALVCIEPGQGDLAVSTVGKFCTRSVEDVRSSEAGNVFKVSLASAGVLARHILSGMIRGVHVVQSVILAVTLVIGLLPLAKESKVKAFLDFFRFSSFEQA